MSVYFSLSMDGNAITDYSDYEVAAFCNGVCRGVADIFEQETNDGMKTICYLRVRSNKPSGENITLRAFRKSDRKDVRITQTIVFASEQQQGQPSAPIDFNMTDYLIGDVNGDGYVDMTDAICIVYDYLKQTPAGFIRQVADVNDDKLVDMTDAIAVVYMYLQLADRKSVV